MALPVTREKVESEAAVPVLPSSLAADSGRGPRACSRHPIRLPATLVQSARRVMRGSAGCPREAQVALGKRWSPSAKPAAPGPELSSLGRNISSRHACQAARPCRARPPVCRTSRRRDLGPHGRDAVNRAPCHETDNTLLTRGAAGRRLPRAWRVCTRRRRLPAPPRRSRRRRPDPARRGAAPASAAS